MAPPNSWKPAKLFTRVALDPDSFRRMIWHNGSRVTWERSAACPCSAMGSLGPGEEPSTTGDAREDCPECFGRGFLYRDATEILAVVVSASKRPEFHQLYGERATGMAMITTQAEHRPKAWDRFTVLDSAHEVTEVRVRMGAAERLRYPITTITLELGQDYDKTDRIETEWTEVYIRRADAQGRLVAEALVNGTDFTIDTDGQVVWGGTASTYATGEFTITATEGTVIPAFTRFRWQSGEDRIDFLTTTEVTADNTNTATFTAQAQTPGTAGNLPTPGLTIVPVDTIDGLGDEAVSVEGVSGGEDGNVPAVGERFTVTYWARPTYIVNDSPHPHRDTMVPTKNAASGGAEAWRHFPVQSHCWLETMGPPHGYATAD